MYKKINKIYNYCNFFIFVALENTNQTIIIMKNLVLVLAVLVSGVVNGQSFDSYKDLLNNTNGDSSFIESNLRSKGFTLVNNIHLVEVKFLDIKESAIMFANPCTNEIVKVSENSVEYIFDGDKELVVKNTDKVLSKENLLFHIMKPITGGWIDNPFVKQRAVADVDTFNGIPGFYIKKGKREFADRVVEINGERLNSLVVLK